MKNSDIAVRKVKKGTPSEKDWHNFPKDIYPEGSQRFRLGHEPAEENLYGLYQFFRGDQAVGRIALYNPPNLNYGDQAAATFGSFECINNPDIALAMLNFSSEEAQKKGKKYLIGPMEGSTWESYRFSLSNREPNFFSEPFHHEYYCELMEAAGMETISRYISQEDLEMKFDANAICQLEDSLKNTGAVFRNLKSGELKNDLVQIGEFCNLSFSNNFLFTPIDPYVFAQKYEKLYAFMDPELVWIIEDSKGQIQALSLSLPDHFDRENKTLIIKTLAKRPDCPWKGIGKILAGKTLMDAKKKGYQRVIHAFMIQDNRSVSISEQYSGQLFKEYALYGRGL